MGYYKTLCSLLPSADLHNSHQTARTLWPHHMPNEVVDTAVCIRSAQERILIFPCGSDDRWPGNALQELPFRIGHGEVLAPQRLTQILSVQPEVLYHRSKEPFQASHYLWRPPTCSAILLTKIWTNGIPPQCTSLPDHLWSLSTTHSLVVFSKYSTRLAPFHCCLLFQSKDIPHGNH